MSDTRELENQTLLLRAKFSPDPELRGDAYLEIIRRLEAWGKISGQRTIPRRVIFDLFRRQMHVRDSDANGVYIPPDRIENDNVKYDYDTDWFMSEDDEDLFSI